MSGGVSKLKELSALRRIGEELRTHHNIDNAKVNNFILKMAKNTSEKQFVTKLADLKLPEKFARNLHNIVVGMLGMTRVVEPRDRSRERHRDRSRDRNKERSERHHSRREYQPPRERRVPSRLAVSSKATGMYGEHKRPSEADRRAARPARRMGDLDRFVANQLVSSGVRKKHEIEEFNDEYVHAHDTEQDQIMDVERNDRAAPFLRGLASRTMTHEPIRLSKNNEGMMMSTAREQADKARERRDYKIEQMKIDDEVAEKSAYERAQAYHDPMSKHKQTSSKAELESLKKQILAQRKREREGWRAEVFGQNVAYGERRSGKTIRQQRESLPIFQLRDAFLQAVRENDMLVVVGETGSGKTTQMTQYLAEASMHDWSKLQEKNGLQRRFGLIGCTQPRRVAALSVAQRVSEEFGCRCGEEVGYTIRFDDTTSQQTIIKYMTDGMLVREALVDPDMQRYSVLILDEAHERSINTDVLFGLLKECVRRRRAAWRVAVETGKFANVLPPLRLVVTSATLNAGKFQEYFDDCPIFKIPGRTFPVEIFYSRENEPDYVEAALDTAMQIHINDPPGDILIFLTGQEEIDSACEALYTRGRVASDKGAPELLVLPIYSALRSEMQTRVFEPAPSGTRKCIVATNIAEASLTIDGIKYVIDPGFCKQKVFNPKLGMDSLQVTPISQASAMQRAGRAGRTGPGKCYRLYPEQCFQHEMLEMPVPEIQRTNMANTVLTLKAMGINDLMSFDFMDPPPKETLVAAMELLYALGALDDDGLLTKHGRRMADFPLEPQLSKCLMQSVDLGCSEEILTVVALLSVDQVFQRPRDKQTQADEKRAMFMAAEGDHITLLNVYEAWQKHGCSDSWSRQHFLHGRALRKAAEVRKQLLAIMDRYQLGVLSCGRQYTRVRKAVVSGFFMNAAKKDPQEGYRTVADGQQVFIHPSSATYRRQPPWILYHKLVLTTREYMHAVTAVEPQWLVEMAPRYFRRANIGKVGGQVSKHKRKEKLEPLFDRRATDQDAWRLSKRRGLQR
ncbi:MAG: hypothetical protein MHM6MM_005419 [Cercozoa sp. M6MM]